MQPVDGGRVVDLGGQDAGLDRIGVHGGEQFRQAQARRGAALLVGVVERVHHPAQPRIVGPGHDIGSRHGAHIADPGAVQERIDDWPVVLSRLR